MQTFPSSESFTPDEQQILTGYFTNIDRPVFGLINLPEVVKGALFARYSRSSKSLRRLFLDEFLRDLPEEIATQQTTGVVRAEQLYDRILTDYGDDSVAQLGGAHLACEGVSNVLTKFLEWGRLMAYLEQSTRYVPYTDRPNGRWKYHIPVELAATDLGARYEQVLNEAFETYASLLLYFRRFSRISFRGVPRMQRSLTAYPFGPKPWTPSVAFCPRPLAPIWGSMAVLKLTRV